MDPEAFHKISYGLYVLTSKDEERLKGQVANMVFQVTSDPPQVAVCVNKNLTHELISRSRVFTISVLSRETPPKFMEHFDFKSGRGDKFAEVK